MENVAANLLAEAIAADLKITVDCGELIVRGPRKAEELARRILAHKPDVIEALTGVIPSACPVCGGPISSIVSADGRGELFGCHSSGGEDWHKWTERKPPSAWSWIVISKPLPVDITARCYNGGCPAIVTFTQGRGCCPRCGVFQRIVE